MQQFDKQAFIGRLNQIITKRFSGNATGLSDSAKIHRPTLQKYLDGLSVPGSENIVLLASAGDCSTDWLLKGEDESHSRPRILTNKQKALLDMFEQFDSLKNKGNELEHLVRLERIHENLEGFHVEVKKILKQYDLL